MLIIGIKCNYCGEVLSMSVRAMHGMEQYGTLPDDWVAVKRGEDDPWHFCSVGCLSLWADDFTRGVINSSNEQ